MTEEEIEKMKKELEWYKAAHWLLANDEAYIFRDDSSAFFMAGVVKEEAQPALAINVSDVFAWGCADAENFPYFDAPKLVEIFKKDGHDGLTRWVHEQRLKGIVSPEDKLYDEKHIERFSPKVAEALKVDRDVHHTKQRLRDAIVDAAQKNGLFMSVYWAMVLEAFDKAAEEK